MSDYCSNSGAGHLSQKIADFWQKRGFDVDVKLVHEAFVPTMRSSRFDIRSNMVNGMPQRVRSEGQSAEA
jgi:hypothetical protein